MKIIVRKESEKMKGTALIEYCGNGMYRYIDCDGNEHILREPIRCKDCKYWAELTFLVPPKHHCGRLLQQYKGISERVSFETDADDFCSRGEKKDE